MIPSLMLYLLLVSTCIAVAAAFVESALLRIPFASRAVWCVAMCTAVLCIVWQPTLRPAVQRQLAAPSQARPAEISETTLLTRAAAQVASLDRTIDRTLAGAVAPDSSTGFDAVLLLFWIAASAVTLLRYCAGASRLRTIALAARHAELNGLPVLVTPSAGPFTFGVIRPQILLPEWLSEFDADARRVALAHEEQHLRHGDPAMLVFGAAMNVVMPWNPAMWYMLARLKRAVEVDCDRRVLRIYPDRRAYAGLLLSIAGRGSVGSFPVAGLVVSRSTLERRFLQMKTKSARFRIPMIVTFVTAAALVAAVPLTIQRPQMRRSVAPYSATVSPPTRTRATGRVHLVSKSGYEAYRVYSPRGAFAKFGEPPRVRADTLSGVVGPGLVGTGLILDVDVTDGPVHILSSDSAGIHVDAAMSGTSPVGWVTAEGTDLIIQSNGIGFGHAHGQKGSR